MNDNRMGKWKLGVLVLVIVTAGLLGYVIWQGMLSKQDRTTYESAQAIADKLNKYTETNQKVPASLSAAGIKTVPSSVTYAKKSSSTYEFCVTFKASNTDVTSQVQQKVTGAALGGLSSGGGAGTNYTPSSLYITANHKAGKQCQTVKPMTFNFSNYFNTNGSSSGGSKNYYNYNSGSSSSLYDYTSGATNSSSYFNQ